MRQDKSIQPVRIARKGNDEAMDPYILTDVLRHAGKRRPNTVGDFDEFDVIDVLETADNAGLKPKYRETGTLKVNPSAFRNVIRASNALHQAQCDLEELQERGGDSSGGGLLSGLFGGAFSGAGAAGLLAKALGGSKDAVDWSVIGGFAGGGIGGMLLGEMAESWRSIRSAERRRDEARARLGKALDDYVARHGPPEL